MSINAQSCEQAKWLWSKAADSVPSTATIFCDFSFISIGEFKNQVQHFLEKMLHGNELHTLEH